MTVVLPRHLARQWDGESAAAASQPLLDQIEEVRKDALKRAQAVPEAAPPPPANYAVPDISMFGLSPPQAPQQPQADQPAPDPSAAIPSLDALGVAADPSNVQPTPSSYDAGGAPAAALPSGPKLPPDEAVKQISALVPRQLPLGDPKAMAVALAPALRFAEQQLGVSAASAFSIIMAENGAGNSPLSRDHNNFFSLSSTRDDPFQSDRSDRFGGYATPGDGVAAFYHWMTQFPRYRDALASGGDHNGFIGGLVKAGYIVPEPGFPVEQWVKNTSASADLFTQAAGQVPAAGVQRGAFDAQPLRPGQGGSLEPIPTRPDPGTSWQPMAARAGGGSLAGNRPSQFGELSWDEAVAACGLAGAVAFAKSAGRLPTVREARDVAVEMGVWDKNTGMKGAESTVALIRKMGVEAHTEQGVDWAKVAQEVGAGNPVLFDTTGGSNGHYYTVEGFNPRDGTFDLGTSATDLKASGGRRHFRPEEIESLGFGRPMTAIYVNNPLTPTKSPNAGRAPVYTVQPPAPIAPKPMAASATAPLALPSPSAPSYAPPVPDLAPDVQADPSSLDTPQPEPEAPWVPGAI